VHEVQARTKQVKAGDANGILMAYVAALTGENTGIIGKMDTEDYNICQSIAVFFV
jgi:hypothetical protein